jgi:hypothetical protein
MRGFSDGGYDGGDLEATATTTSTGGQELIESR